MQRHYPFVDILLRSRDIRDQVTKLSEITSKFWVGQPKFFGGAPPPSKKKQKFLSELYKSGSPGVAKFGNDRLSDLGD